MKFERSNVNFSLKKNMSDTPVDVQRPFLDNECSEREKPIGPFVCRPS